MAGILTDGFKSAAVTQLFAPAIDNIGGDNAAGRTARIVVAAIVGGTAAELGGGKFANGAVTGAFSRAYNHESHSDIPITDDERVLADKGDWEGFYEARIARGDGYASRAYEMAKGETFPAMSATAKVEAALEIFDSQMSINDVRVSLAKAYSRYLVTDNVGRIGVLHAGEIAQFHYEVFNAAGISGWFGRALYGGTPFGTRIEASFSGRYVCSGPCDSGSRFDK